MLKILLPNLSNIVAVSSVSIGSFFWKFFQEFLWHFLTFAFGIHTETLWKFHFAIDSVIIIFFFFKWQEIQPGIPLNMKLKKCFVFTLQISAIFLKLHILAISVRKWRNSSGDCFTKLFQQFFIRIFSVNLLGNSSVIIISNPQKISSATPWEFLSIFFRSFQIHHSFQRSQEILDFFTKKNVL